MPVCSAAALQSHRDNRCGFTLVELLVVIGIIALLISILLPSLGKAREAANTVKCLANLKSLGQASNLYTTDNHGCMVPAGYLDVATGLSSGYILDNYATILISAGYLTAPKVNSPTEAPSSSPSVFYCPNGLTDTVGVYWTAGAGATGKPVMKTRIDGQGARPWRAGNLSTTGASVGLTPGLIVDTWYGINAIWGGSLGTAQIPSLVIPENTGSPPAFVYRKLSSIPHISEMVFMYDGTFYDLTYDANRINARHNKQTKTNILYFDGHAATSDTKELPGGAGDANATGGLGSTIFNSATALQPWPLPRFRLDQ